MLKDPFKKTIPKDTKLLAYGPQSDKDNQEVESPPGLTPVERFGVIGGSITLVVVVLYCLRRYTTWRPWSDFIPNLKMFAKYQRETKKNGHKSKSKSAGTKSPAEKTTEVRVTPAPDQLALLSSVV